jgi:hypothetical protein
MGEMIAINAHKDYLNSPKPEQQIENAAEIKYIVPANKEMDIKNYAAKLSKKFPHIKRHRLMKKVAEYFHLETQS